MKKNLLFLGILLTGISIISSCSKSSTPTPVTTNPVIGRWEFKSINGFISDTSTHPPTGINDDSTYVTGKAPVVTFAADSSYTIVDDGVTPSVTIQTGTFTTNNGNQIVLTPTSGVSEFHIANYTISGATMTVTFSGSVSGSTIGPAQAYPETGTLILTRIS
jgi:hypothetical protein